VEVIVSEEGNGDYTSINDAIKSVEPWTTIRVKSGIYDESVKIEKPLRLIGEDDVIITNAIDFKADVGVIRNFTLESHDRVASIVTIRGGALILEGCDISPGIPNNSGYGVIIMVHRGKNTNVLIKGNKIHSNSQHGIRALPGSKGICEDNELWDNRLGAKNIVAGSQIQWRNNTER
jgi:pectin methylesterase-like acyl-CoA thioesterase